MEEDEEMPENRERNRKGSKKIVKNYLYYISIAISIIGIIGTVVLMMLSYYVLDISHKEAINQIEQTNAIMAQVEAGLDASIVEVSNLENTVDGLDSTVSQLKDSVTLMGGTLKDFGQTISGISLVGLIGFQEEGQMMKDTGDSFIQTGESFDKIDLGSHKAAISEFKNKLTDLKTEISNERAAIESTQKTSRDVFSILKAMAIIFCVLEIMLFGVILMNSLAGM